jgi:hypothetical protein
VRRPPETADFLFVQNARGIAYADGKLASTGVNPVTVMFSDRPDRIAGHMATEGLVPFWSEGEDGFLKDPPNAAVAFLEDKDMEDAVVVLPDPLLAGDDLTYSVEILEGEIPGKGGSGIALNRCDRHAADAGVLRRGSPAHPFGSSWSKRSTRGSWRPSPPNTRRAGRSSSPQRTWTPAKPCSGT